MGEHLGLLDALVSAKVFTMARSLAASAEFRAWYGLGETAFPNLEAIKRLVLGGLLFLRATAAQQSPSGLFAGGVLEDLDAMSGVPGFGIAMHEVGWAEEEDGDLYLANLPEWTSEPKKPARRQPVAAAREAPIPPELDTHVFRTAWATWVRHRSEIRKPLKPAQIAAQLDAFAEMGESRAVAAIKHTVKMGWQGLREPDPVDAGLSRQANGKPSLKERIDQMFAGEEP